MSQTRQKEETFLHCSCPQCRRPFDYVPVDVDDCPFCKTPIDRQAVWLTRKYPGIIMFPGWVKAFGWPFLMILAGFAIPLYEIWAYRSFEPKLPALLISMGVIFFFVKINTNGEY